jgi:lipoate-protein ligase A
VAAHPYPPATWRLLSSPPADGATNMAIDEAIVRAVAAGRVWPTLRLYAWTPPCLSLGRAQAGDEVDRAACARDGVHVVRRPTGGRAILHTDELTYSVVAPPHEPRLAGDLLTSYHRLSQALLAALAHLGATLQTRDTGHATRITQHGTRDTNPVCFETPSHYELVAGDGRKLVGSAQMRVHGAVLQHGTLPLVGDMARICHYLADPPDPARVRARAVALEGVLGRPVGWEQAAEAMVAGFGAALNLRLRPGELTLEEQGWWAELRAEKYASDAWTWRS